MGPGEDRDDCNGATEKGFVHFQSTGRNPLAEERVYVKPRLLSSFLCVSTKHFGAAMYDVWESRSHLGGTSGKFWKGTCHVSEGIFALCTYLPPISPSMCALIWHMTCFCSVLLLIDSF